MADTFRTASTRPGSDFGRVLVTGANGFVGKILTHAISSRFGSAARIFGAGREADFLGGRAVPLDLLDQASVDRAVKATRPDLVIHLAAQSSVAQAVDGAATTWAINAGGSLNLARSIAAASLECTVLYASTAEVYGKSFNEGRVNEQTALRPQMAYARSKAAAENILDDVLPPSVRLIIARPVNHSGAGQTERFVIPAFAAQIARAERGMATEIRTGNLDAMRDFLHVDDVVEAYIDLLSNAAQLPTRCVFNISSGGSARIHDVLKGLLALSTTTVRVVADPSRMRPSDVPAIDVSSELLRAVTGWSPRRSLDVILRDVLADQRNQVANGALM